MFMVPLEPNLNCAYGFQTLPFISSFQKYKLDDWLLDWWKKMCPVPLPSSSPHSRLTCQKHQWKPCRPKRAGVLTAARRPSSDQQPPRTQATRCRVRKAGDTCWTCIRLPAVDVRTQDRNSVFGRSSLHASPLTKTPSRIFANFNSVSGKDVNLNMFGSWTAFLKLFLGTIQHLFKLYERFWYGTAIVWKILYRYCKLTPGPNVLSILVKTLCSHLHTLKAQLEWNTVYSTEGIIIFFSRMTCFLCFSDTHQ